MTAIDLSGKRGLVVGIANEHSLAWAATRHFRAAGAELAITCHNERSKAFVAPLAEQVGAPLLVPCDVLRPGELEAVFDAVRGRWGRLDFLFHSLAGARARDLGGRLLDCPVEGFAEAIRVNAISAGPVSTRAASGIRHLDELLDESSRRAAEHRLGTVDEVVHVDAGFHIEGMVFHGHPEAGR